MYLIHQEGLIQHRLFEVNHLYLMYVIYQDGLIQHWLFEVNDLYLMYVIYQDGFKLLNVKLLF